MALGLIEPFLARVREVPGLTEKKTGVFYCGAKAFLHFHEDEAGMFADVSLPTGWVRVPINSEADENSLIALISEHAPRQK